MWAKPQPQYFFVLPPHWTVDNPVEHADVHDALQLMYGVIMVAQHPTSIKVLVRVLASVAFASDWLVATSGRHAGHPFLAVPLLQNPEFLLCLKTKVATKPTETMFDAPQSGDDFTT